MIKEIPVCAFCGCSDISSDATAVWSADEQDWILSDVCDATWCAECEGECSINMVVQP